MTTRGTCKPACKRTALEITLIAELVERGDHHMRWAPTTQMVADFLTKLDNQEGLLVDILDGVFLM